MARPTEEDARRRDAADAFPPPRDEFLVPPWDGRYPEVAYFAGNSLGLQPAALAGRLSEELEDWGRLAVNGHRESRRPWVSYHELLRAPAARLVGARPAEVVAMNSLTVNLHLLMASFYRPTPERSLILVEDTAYRAVLDGAGVEYRPAGSPEALGKIHAADVEKWGKVIRDAGIKAN